MLFYNPPHRAEIVGLRMHPPVALRFFLRGLFRLVIAALFVGIPGALIFLKVHGPGDGVRDLVCQALSGEKFSTRIDRLTFDPFQGLVADGVSVFDRTQPGRVLAATSRVILSLNLNELVHGQVYVDSLALREANCAIPLDGEMSSQRLELQGVNAQIILLPGVLRLARLDFRLYGIRVSVSGSLLNPRQLRPPAVGAPTDPAAPRPGGEIARVIDVLKEFHFGQPSPTIEAEISGDLANPETFRVDRLELQGGPLTVRRFSADSVSLFAKYSSKRLKLERFVVMSGGHSLRLSADWNASCGKIDFDLDSAIDPLPALASFAPDAVPPGLSGVEMPALSCTGSVLFGGASPSLDTTGHFDVGAIDYRGVHFEGVSMDFSVRDRSVYVRNARVGLGAGELWADALLQPGSFRLRLDSTIVPTALAPAMDPKAREIMDVMQFKDAPHITLEFSGPSPSLPLLTGTGHVTLGRTAMRGAWIEWADSDVLIADRAVTYNGFRIGRAEGVGSGTFAYDFGRQEVRLKDIRSAMWPYEVMLWIDPGIARTLEAYRFRAPPTVTGEGVVGLKDRGKTNLSIQIKAPGGIDYDLLKKTLKFGKTDAKLLIRGPILTGEIPKAALMGGDLGMKIRVSLDPAVPVYSADIDAHRVDFAPLTKLYFGYEHSKGRMSAKYAFSTRMGEERFMEGKGSIRVEDGSVFDIPVFGPLSDILNTIIPGSGYQTARLATADFTIAKEKINTRNLAIEGAGFSMYGEGDIYFMSDKMDLSVRINARGLPGIVLFPVSKLFEYVSRGTVSDPQWRPKIIPKELYGAPSASGEDGASGPAKKKPR